MYTVSALFDITVPFFVCAPPNENTFRRPCNDRDVRFMCSPNGCVAFFMESPFKWVQVIQYVPIKRKLVLSVTYLHCHAIFYNQTICFIIKGIFSSIWYQTHDDISMHDWKGIIWTHACQNRFAQNIGVELIWPSSDLLIHVKIRSLSRRNMTKETKEMLMNVFPTCPSVLKCGRPREALKLIFCANQFWPVLGPRQLQPRRDRDETISVRDRDETETLVFRISYFHTMLQARRSTAIIAHGSIIDERTSFA